MEITPGLLLRAYAHGLFPMARSAESDELYWFDPPSRGIIPLDDFHIPRRLRRELRRGTFEVRYDTAFAQVLEACATPAADRPTTWINSRIVELYSVLFDIGHAHSVECWRDGELVGGLYGVSLKSAFFGESMFSRVTNASKVALVHLVALLRWGGFTLLDTQFTTNHLSRFGGVEVAQRRYKKMLAEALLHSARFRPEADADALTALLARPPNEPPDDDENDTPRTSAYPMSDTDH